MRHLVRHMVGSGSCGASQVSVGRPLAPAAARWHDLCGAIWQCYGATHAMQAGRQAAAAAGDAGQAGTTQSLRVMPGSSTHSPACSAVHSHSRPRHIGAHISMHWGEHCQLTPPLPPPHHHSAHAWHGMHAALASMRHNQLALGSARAPLTPTLMLLKLRAIMSRAS